MSVSPHFFVYVISSADLSNKSESGTVQVAFASCFGPSNFFDNGEGDRNYIERSNAHCFKPRIATTI